jgi:hypothetical protein
MRRWSFLARTVDMLIGSAVFKAHSRLLPAVVVPIRIQTRTSILRMRNALWRTTSNTTTTTLLIILTSLVRVSHLSHRNSVTLLFYRPASRHRCSTHKCGKLYPPVRLLLIRLLNLPTDSLSDLAHLSHSTLANLSSSFRAPGEIRI